MGAAKRPTISDVARRAGVSKGAVSYALNGLPGVSDATRKRILEVAETLGFRANTAARALAGASTKVIGLAARRPAAPGAEPFLMELVSGLQAELSPLSYAVLMQVAADSRAEVELYRRWWSERRVDGVLLCDPRESDERVVAVRQLGLPAVVVGPADASGTLPSVWSDDASSTVEVVEHLAALGHRRIARVGGPPGLAYTAVRTAAFAGACDRLGLDARAAVHSDGTGEAAERATRAMLGGASRPTALIYDNAAMAVAGCAVAQRLGLSIPDDVSLVVVEDSPVCRFVNPPLTALSRDAGAYGRHAARLLLAAIAAAPVTGQHQEPVRLICRGSTGRAPG